MKKYDYLIIGAGLFGATIANRLHNSGKKILIIEKRNHIAGNTFTENIGGIIVHKYGAHIFHTNDKAVWEYITSFSEFNNFINSPIAKYKNEIYNLPFNMNTFNKLWPNVQTKKEALKQIKKENKNIIHANNLEEEAIKQVGTTIYKKIIKEYTEKQWNKKCQDLPPFIIKRIPLKFTYDNNYYDDIYQGIPKYGYTKLIEKMISGIEINLNTNFFDKPNYYKSIAKKIIYTGKLDEYYGYKYGKLEYRSLKFETKILNTEDYQSNAIVNYTSHDVKYTRIIEHKHFDKNNKSKKTIISYEYPQDYNQNNEPFYPINNHQNNKLAAKYLKLAKKEKNVIFGGRLAEYKYYNMDEIIKRALTIDI